MKNLMMQTALLLLLCTSCGNGGSGGEGDGDATMDPVTDQDSFDPADADGPDLPADGSEDPADEDVDPDAVRVPLWSPFAEWSYENASWEGNPFDLQARADFSDGRSPHLFYDGDATWKLRYMCTEVGVFSFVTASDDPELDGLSGTVVCEDNPGAPGLLVAGGTGNGKFYVRGWEKSIVPAWCMMPDISRNSTGEPTAESVIDEWIANNIDETGFLGAHNFGPANIWYDWDCDGTRAGCTSEEPDPRTFRAYEDLMIKLYGHGAFVHIWLFWDCARDKCDRYHDDTALQERMRHYLADRWGAVPNWMIGEGFDNFEDDDTAFADKWYHDISDRLAWPHFIGMRSYHNSYDMICTECNYLSWENVEMTYDRWVSSYDTADRPSFEEDRYRVRDEGRPKDIPPDRLDMMLRDYLWPQVMSGGVGAVYGYLIGAPDHYSLTEGYPAEWNAAIQAWHDFWYASGADPAHRFLGDMERCNDLTSGRGLCVRGRAYVFYAEATTSITFDLSGLSAAGPAVAMDTWTGEMVDLGTLGPADTAFTAPHESDWVVAVGEFE